MRLARLVAAGLVAGVVTGFAVALLRPRRHVPPAPSPAEPVGPVVGVAEVAEASPSGAAPDASADGEPSDDVVLDVRTRRSVKG